MNARTIRCESCEGRWALASGCSLYEQQEVESRPCPRCGACTLSCPDPQQEVEEDRPRRGRPKRALLQTA